MRPYFHRILAIAIGFSVPVGAWFGVPVAGDRPGAQHALVPVAVAGEIDPAAVANAGLNRQLASVLAALGFTGAMEASLESRLGRPIERRLADLGRLLWFDTITGLNDDNSCGGCHSPTNGFGDTQSIAIGIDNNNLVGPSRTGPRNQRRTPIVINNVFYPNLMWNSRFASLSEDPFDNGAGFSFPPPEGLSLSHLQHLLQAQAFIPPTERNEVAGFEFPGDNFAIRAEVLNRLNAIQEYRRLFGQSFPEVKRGAPITFEMFGRAIAEFEFTLAFTDAPLDRFARGEQDAMSASQKRGALLFFGKAGCVGCHAVSGSSNEMFSDFRMHVIGVPQIAPAVTNSVFDGPGSNEDFGLEQITGVAADRYMFRSSPLRNLAVQPTFMHNGCFTSIEDAVRHHLDVFASARAYTPVSLDEDLRGPLGPIEPVLARVDPLLSEPIALTEGEFHDLVSFLREGLLDPRAEPANLMRLIPARVPSGRPVMIFETPVAPALAATPEGAVPSVESRSGAHSARSSPPAVQVRLQTVGRGPEDGTVMFEVNAARAGRGTVRLYDVEGRLVRTLLDGEWLAAGAHPLAWDGRGEGGEWVAKGVYFVHARVGTVTAVTRILRL